MRNQDLLDSCFSREQQAEILRELAADSVPSPIFYNKETNIVTICKSVIELFQINMRPAMSDGVLRLKKPLPFLDSTWDSKHPPLFNFPEYDRSLFSVHWSKSGSPDISDNSGFLTYHFTARYVGEALNNVNDKGDFINARISVLSNFADAAIFVSAFKRNDFALGSMYSKPACTLSKVTTSSNRFTLDAIKFPAVGLGSTNHFSKVTFFNTGYTFKDLSACFMFAEEQVIFTYSYVTVTDQYTPSVQAPVKVESEAKFKINAPTGLPNVTLGLPKCVPFEVYKPTVTTVSIKPVPSKGTPGVDVEAVCADLQRKLDVLFYTVESYDYDGDPKIRVKSKDGLVVMEMLNPATLVHPDAWHLVYMGLQAANNAHIKGVAAGVTVVQKRMENANNRAFFFTPSNDEIKYVTITSRKK